MGAVVHKGRAGPTVRRSITIFLVVFLLAASVPAFASVYDFLYTSNTGTVRTPSVTLAAGTAGSSTISGVAADAATVSLVAGMTFYETSNAPTSCSAPTVDTSLTAPGTTGQFVFNGGQTVCLWSPQYRSDSTSSIQAGNSALNLYAQTGVPANTFSTSTTGSASQILPTFDNGLYWVFYSDGTNIVYRTSSDGLTWSAATTVRAGTSSAYFSAWFDTTNNKVYYAYAAGASASFFQRAGTLNSGGTISWDYAEVTVTGSNNANGYPSIVKDTSATPILYIAMDSLKSGGASKGNYISVWKCTVSSAANCGTNTNWSNSENVRVDSTHTGTIDAFIPDLVPMTTSRLTLGYQATNAAAVVSIQTYSGTTWNAAITTTSTYAFNEFGIVAIGGTAYFAAVLSSTRAAYYFSCAYPCGSAPTETSLSTTATFAGVGISSDGSSTLVVSYSATGASVSVYYKVSTNGGTSWGAEQTLVSAESVSTDSVTMAYAMGNSVFPIVWTSSSGFNVRFAAIAVASATLTVSFETTTSGGVVQNVLISSGTTASISPSKASVPSTFASSAGAVPTSGYLEFTMAATLPVTIYWGPGQLTNFQTPSIYNYVLAIQNGASVAWNVNLATTSGQLSNAGRVTTTLSFVSPSSNQIIVTSGTLTQGVGTAQSLAASGTIDIEVVATANTLPSSTNAPSTITFSIKVASTTTTAFAEYTVVLTID